MLLRENLGRGHEGGGIACLKTLPDQCGGHQGFAAADIALKKPAHLSAGGHVGSGLFDGAALRPGGRERERFIEGCEIGFRNNDAAAVCFPSAAERTGEEKQFFKDKTLPGLIQYGGILRKMNVLIGVFRGHQTVPGPDGFRKQFGNLPAAAVQPLPDALPECTLLKPAAQAIDRDNSPGDGHPAGGQLLGLKDRICEASAGALHLHPSEEAIGTAALKLIPDIRLVKIGDAYFGAVVIDPKPHHIQTAANPGQPRFVRDNGGNTGRLAVLNQGGGFHAAAVFIASREIGNQVKQRKDAQLVQSLRPFLSDSFDTSNVFSKRFHRVILRTVPYSLPPRSWRCRHR